MYECYFLKIIKIIIIINNYYYEKNATLLSVATRCEKPYAIGNYRKFLPRFTQPFAMGFRAWNMAPWDIMGQ